MRAFIIRPFGTRSIRVKGQDLVIDFDAVERELIDPALTTLGIVGRTTLDIVRQGNIRVDMFQRLLAADLVIADVSVHNANVYYELGIRHALREKRTFLLRAKLDDFPFDLQTDRYFVYDVNAVARGVEDFVRALRHTIDAQVCDSPVFRALPALEQQDSSRFVVVPTDFLEDVERVAAKPAGGQDLSLLASETEGLEWELEGLRAAGCAQFDIKAYADARVTWERVREFNDLDVEANRRLATIYQRLGDLSSSDLAIGRALQAPGLADGERSQLEALRGRNARTRWDHVWGRLAEDACGAVALRSDFLEDAIRHYRTAFRLDLNYYYAGLNALEMLTIQLALAKRLPEVWEERFGVPAAARAELEARQALRDHLVPVVAESIAGTEARLERDRQRSVWLPGDRAYFACLTEERPSRVASAYQNAFDRVPESHQLEILGYLSAYRRLGVMRDKADAVLQVHEDLVKKVELPASCRAETRFIVFAGHVVDEAGRIEPRFPADKAEQARAAIRREVEEELAWARGLVGDQQVTPRGIAGGSSGGDILFHEVCEQLAIPSELYLAVPRVRYIAEPISKGGDWAARFDRLYRRLPHHVLMESGELPRWLRARENYDVWARNRRWMFFHALANGAENASLIALWNGKEGATAEVVREADRRGARVRVIDTAML